KVTDITQSTQKASINWNKFNIASDETVNFKQPNSSSITLNRVVGNEKSIINGALNANGQVWIINSNGVLFGKGASINTSGLLATTKDISDADFQAGNYNFKGNSKESVINLGTIDVINSGSVILAANEVRNEGTIKAIRGKIHLAGADEYTVNLNGNSLVNLTVNKGVLDSLVKNSGNIIADGGEIYLTTNAVNELLKGVVNNTGIIEANSLDGITGHVNISSNVVINTGKIKGSSSNINIKAGFLNDSGLTDVSSDSSAAGNINIETLQMSQSKNSSIKANSANDNAGLITIKSDTNNENSSFYLSGNIEATGLNGGKVQITANKLSLVGSTVDTSGKKNAG
ncbi:filamentous hemagglutinin N-terminal domain-containing protein, partial [Aliarcobacter butzleri]